MATDLAEVPAVDTPWEDPEGEQPSSDGGGLRFSGKKLKVAALLLTVMGVQMAIGYMLLPEPAVSSTENPGDNGIGEEAIQASIDTVEVTLGTFNPTNSRGPSGSVVHVSFELTAIVASSNKQPLLDAVKNTHGARIRSAIVRVIRSSNLEDLNDPDLNVIKRKIREEINKVLQKTYVNEVVVDRFRLMPQ